MELGLVVFLQVVYSGPMAEAAGYFSSMGLVPDSLRTNIADFMLDAVIKSSSEDVDAMLAQFSR